MLAAAPARAERMHPMRSMSRLLLLALLLLAAPLAALANDPCPWLRDQIHATDPATRLAAAACEEHQLWYRPFIDIEGRYAGTAVREADATPLANGEQAWRRVAGYWRGTDQLSQLMQRPGAVDCMYASYSDQPSAGCRSFLMDVPWSAAFVSWVARRAMLPGFRGSPSHIDYVREAFRNPQTSAYRVAHPVTARPARGDMLCYVRHADRIFGFRGLAHLLSSDDGGLGMHCDIVVGAGNGQAQLIGGNVLDAVSMRLLPLTPGGQFAGLAQRALDDPSCSPDALVFCNANRQDWAVLLQLRPASELAGLVPSMGLYGMPPPVPATPSPQPAPCCVECSAGDSVPRCPGT